ncbi:MAG: 50S ribosomal protein L22 [Clostridiales bacterium]|jgi:large subunit ribosomal protein L22|nr:50S ribosomal protein L22 [Clostridiales bacterium]HOB63618.1 50S ribosomal protein L22 [Clostridia bacterium]HOK81971.1 50S ribosomal protein L22 [Clostridia bacterium]HOL61215.1 50S ribosomal protein L22 [Clostridia bacterium]HPO53893.1 50S ribosomal protein L22 [Clostridia bacterium]
MATRIREKTKQRQENKDKRPYAVAKHIRISPYKVRAVLDVIRGKGYNEAVAMLKSINKSSSLPVLKVLNSAAANAENNLGMNKDELYVAECFADQGTTIKRYMPRARGRIGAILKRTSHITVILDDAANK